MKSHELEILYCHTDIGSILIKVFIDLQICFCIARYLRLFTCMNFLDSQLILLFTKLLWLNSSQSGSRLHFRGVMKIWVPQSWLYFYFL